jgi:aldehyde dehydrogenase (NAD+)
MKYDFRKFYIGGEWSLPSCPNDYQVINPATEEAVGMISLGSTDDAGRAVAAAKAAFPGYSQTTPTERSALMARIFEAYKERYAEVAEAICAEIGAPITMSNEKQAAIGAGHIATMLDVLKGFSFEETLGTTRIELEPVGVCALITPWNWPINQIACKVLPALAAGCTMVLKPSEFSPLSAMIWAKVMEDAGVPPGVFNLVNGDGATVGAALSSHRDIDMVSFTGSVRAGAEVARNAAAGIKRVHQELGGKSPNIEDLAMQAVESIVVGDPCDARTTMGFGQAVASGIQRVMLNSGQGCAVPSRMLVPATRLGEVEDLAMQAVESIVVGDPCDARTTMGPVASRIQYERVQSYIVRGIEEGATLLCGGPGRPSGLTRGYFVRPTVFSRVNNAMTIAREEIFGPVLAIIPYHSDQEAIDTANDTDYGLSSYVWSSDLVRAQRVAQRIRAGMVHINGAGVDLNAPFGGYKKSGNGREWGVYGLRNFLEIKAIMCPPMPDVPAIGERQKGRGQAAVYEAPKVAKVPNFGKVGESTPAALS